jgi:hypothetical protein
MEMGAEYPANAREHEETIVKEIAGRLPRD